MVCRIIPVSVFSYYTMFYRGTNRDPMTLQYLQYQIQDYWNMVYWYRRGRPRLRYMVLRSSRSQRASKPQPRPALPILVYIPSLGCLDRIRRIHIRTMPTM